VGSLFAPSRRRDLGLRLLPDHGSLLSTALCVLPHRTEDRGAESTEASDLLPILGFANTSEKLRHRVKRQRICFVRTRAHVGPVLRVWRQRVRLKCFKPPLMRRQLRRSANASPGVSDKKALPHLLLLHENQLHRVLKQDVASFNLARAHQGMRQQLASTEQIISCLSSSRGQGESWSEMGWAPS
jgi:hypothetical protein